MTDAPPLDAVLAALADPTRRAILAQLAEGEATVSDLAAGFPISQPAISRHLKVLTEAGLILRSVEAQRRPARLNPAALAPLDQFIGGLREVYEARFNQLDRVLDELPDAPPPLVSTPKET